MKVIDGKPIATEDSDLTEGDAAEYDNLLSENIRKVFKLMLTKRRFSQLYIDYESANQS